MKLLRVGNQGFEKPAIMDQHDQIRDLSGHVSDFGGANISLEALAVIQAIDLETLPILDASTRIACPLSFVPNFFCIGLNYASHAAETGLRIPREPIIFSKASSALSGPFDEVILPKGSEKSDWEVELGVVIGKEAYEISQNDALDYVSAYCTINDLSERHFQTERSGQWIKGKSSPGFGPVGPFLLTSDEIEDVQNLDISLKLNGQIEQISNTSDMIFPVARIISYMSQFMRLQPGDIIATGTPSGVGMGQSPQKFLKNGDQLEASVEYLGTHKQTIKA